MSASCVCMPTCRRVSVMRPPRGVRWIRLLSTDAGRRQTPHLGIRPGQIRGAELGSRGCRGAESRSWPYSWLLIIHSRLGLATLLSPACLALAACHTCPQLLQEQWGRASHTDLCLEQPEYQGHACQCCRHAARRHASWQQRCTGSHQCAAAWGTAPAGWWRRAWPSSCAWTARQRPGPGRRRPSGPQPPSTRCWSGSCWCWPPASGRGRPAVASQLPHQLPWPPCSASWPAAGLGLADPACDAHPLGSSLAQATSASGRWRLLREQRALQTLPLDSPERSVLSQPGAQGPPVHRWRG